MEFNYNMNKLYMILCNKVEANKDLIIELQNMIHDYDTCFNKLYKLIYDDGVKLKLDTMRIKMVVREYLKYFIESEE